MALVCVTVTSVQKVKVVWQKAYEKFWVKSLISPLLRSSPEKARQGARFLVQNPAG